MSRFGGTVDDGKGSLIERFASIGDQEGAQRLAEFDRAHEIVSGDLGVRLDQIAVRKPGAERGRVRKRLKTLFKIDRIDECLDERQLTWRRRAITRFPDGDPRIFEPPTPLIHLTHLTHLIMVPVRCLLARHLLLYIAGVEHRHTSFTGDARSAIDAMSGTMNGLRAALPLGIAGLGEGIAFGALARQAGLSTTEATLMSSVVCAGTAQFLAIGLWTSPLPIATILVTTLGVNLRHLLMGATLQSWLASVPPRRRYPSLHVLSDESWALTTRELSRGHVRHGFLIGSGLVLFCCWIAATFVGATLGQAIDDPARWGLDFAFVAVFGALLVGLWPGRQRALPWLVAGTTALAAERVLPTGWHVLAGGLAGTLVGVLRRGD